MDFWRSRDCLVITVAVMGHEVFCFVVSGEMPWPSLDQPTGIGTFPPFQSDRFDGSSCQEQTLAMAHLNDRLGVACRRS